MSEAINQVKTFIEKVNKDNEELRAELNKAHADLAKVAKIEESVVATQRSIDELNAKINLSSNGFESTKTESIDANYKEVLNRKLLRGVKKYDLSDAERRVVDEYNRVNRALEVGDANNNSGGYLVPTDNPLGIVAQVRAITPWMDMVETGNTAARDPVRLIQTVNFGVSVSPETSAATNLSSGEVEEVRGAMGNYTAEPWATEDMLADVSFDLVGYINSNIAETISFKLSSDFLTGAATGAGVRGLLADAALSSVATWDRIGEITATQPVSAIAAGGAGFGIDDIYDTFYAIDMRYRMNTADLSILGSNATIKTLAKFKDNDGQYLYRPSVNAGDPALFNGVRVMEAPTMTNFTAAGNPVALIGNFRQAYALLQQPQGTKSVVDVITNKAYTKYYYKQRNAGFYKDLRALRVLVAK